MVNSKSPLFNFKRPPALLIGSGIVKRYSSDSRTWRELLKRVAENIGIDEDRFKAFESAAMTGCNEKIGYLPKLASSLKEYLNLELIAGRLKISDMLSQDDYDLYMNSSNPDPIKFMVATELNKVEMTTEPRFLEEIDLMKKLPDIVPCVITTNFDKFIDECIFDNRFAIYSRVSDYYLSGSQGIGEIYKIHGTVDHPEGLILNEEDYVQFFDRSKIVSAKILSILCDYPMVIMGYSMNDPDVINIIEDLITSLDEDKLIELNNNVICIDRIEGKMDLEWGDSYYGYGNKRVRIRTLKTDNFEAVLKELSMFTPSKSPSEIRRFRQLVKKVVASTDSSTEVYYSLGIDEITAENRDKLVIAIGDRRSVQAYSKIVAFNSHSLMIDVLHNKNEFVPKEVLENFIISRIRLDEYIPLFHYLRILDMDPSEYPELVTKFIRLKRKQFAGKLNNQTVKSKLSKKEYTKDILFDEGIWHYTKPLLVMHYYDKGEINESQAIELLRRMY